MTRAGAGRGRVRRILGSVVACVCLASGAVAGEDQLKDLLAALEGSADVTTRCSLVRKIVSQNSPAAAARLLRIAKNDPAPEVRATAARGIGSMKDVQDAEQLQLALLDYGGVKEVRRAVAAGLIDRGGQLPALLRILADPEMTALSKGLVVEAIASFPGPEPVVVLERLARGPDPFLRCEALRGLARHPEGQGFLPSVLVDVLGEHQDLETVLSGLDLASDFADGDFRPLADLLDTFLQPEVQPAVESARARIEYMEALAAFDARKGTVYDSGGEPPEPPPPRPRLDMVYVFDATGSVVGHLDLIIRTIKDEADVLRRAGGDVRLGLVAYRDTPKRRATWETHALPLTYDVERAEQWFRDVDSGGADSRGAAIARGLHQGLDRMGWRWSKARRHCMLVADSKASSQADCENVAGIHFRSDRTRVHVWYLARTRTQIPESVSALSRVGGGRVRIVDHGGEYK